MLYQLSYASRHKLTIIGLRYPNCKGKSDQTLFSPIRPIFPPWARQSYAPDLSGEFRQDPVGPSGVALSRGHTPETAFPVFGEGKAIPARQPA
jgi:hypothetical protein